jgi:hypothetical protein
MADVDQWVSVRYPEYTKAELASAYSDLVGEREHPLELPLSHNEKWPRLYAYWYANGKPSKSWKYRCKGAKAYQRHMRWGFKVKPVKLTRIMADVQAWMSATDYMMVA